MVYVLAGFAAVEVLPSPSSVSLACARLGWAVEDTAVVTVVGRPVELLAPHVTPGRRLLVLGSDGRTPADVAAIRARAEAIARDYFGRQFPAVPW